MQIKPQWDTNLHLSECLSITKKKKKEKDLRITNVGKDVEEKEPLYTVVTVDGNVNWCSHCGKQYGGFSES